MTRLVTIDYTNYRGERGIRVIEPQRLFLGANEFHPGVQWLLAGRDVARDVERVFAVRDIHRMAEGAFPDGTTDAWMDAPSPEALAHRQDTWQRAVQCAVSHLDYESGAPEGVLYALRSLRSEFLKAGGYAAGTTAKAS